MPLIMEKEIPKYRVIYFWVGRFLCLGRIIDNSEHAHHALQVILNRDGIFQLRVERRLIECGGVLVASDCPHQLLSSSDFQVHLLLDHETEVAETIAKRHLQEGKVKILEGPLLDRLRKCIAGSGNFLGSCEKAHTTYRKLVYELGGYQGHTKTTIDPRIQSVLNVLQEKYLFQKTAIAELARHACLSESRLMHLFAEEIGIPLRHYVLWLRLMTALRFAIQGESLTEAAHNAGFADSAHLSRTFRRMYGITLSEALKNSQFVQVISCLS